MIFCLISLPASFSILVLLQPNYLLWKNPLIREWATWDFSNEIQWTNVISSSELAKTLNFFHQRLEISLWYRISSVGMSLNKTRRSTESDWQACCVQLIIYLLTDIRYQVLRSKAKSKYWITWQKALTTTDLTNLQYNRRTDTVWISMGAREGDNVCIII